MRTLASREHIDQPISILKLCIQELQKLHYRSQWTFLDHVVDFSITSNNYRRLLMQGPNSERNGLRLGSYQPSTAYTGFFSFKKRRVRTIISTPRSVPHGLHAIERVLPRIGKSATIILLPGKWSGSEQQLQRLAITSSPMAGATDLWRDLAAGTPTSWNSKRETRYVAPSNILPRRRCAGPRGGRPSRARWRPCGAPRATAPAARRRPPRRPPTTTCPAAEWRQRASE